MKTSLVCLLALVAVAITAPQFPILSPIGSPVLPVQPGSQDQLGRLIPGGFVYPGQGNVQIGSWPWGLENLMPFYPADPRFIGYRGMGFSVSIGNFNLNPIEEVKPVAPIVPPAKIEVIPVESKPTELISSTPTVAIPRCNKDDRKRRSAPSNAVGYMVGSTFAPSNQYPFMVALVEYNDRTESYELACGGSLVSSNKILTAAHCVTKYKKTSLIPASRFRVKFGMNFLNATADDAELSRKVKHITIHEDYDPINVYNDIAILTLNSPVEYTDNISPVCLVPKCFEDDENQEVIAMGWGNTKYKGDNSDYLRHAYLSTVPFAKCQRKWDGEVDEDMMLCAYKKGQDTCQNDSGGPLVMEFQDDAECRFMQVGIVSFGDGCGTSTAPGVYVRVKKYLSWINDNTED